ncbi:MAG TPA: cupin domain-containing protein [Thermomicrobiales bacterium]|nr:cupin domain-containing protein [Thermomicrobiales bacterium]
MSEKIRVVPSDALEAGPPTAGMTRSQAFAAENLWVGEVRTAAGAISGWHHHGEHTTIGRVLAGTLRFEFAAGGAESLDAGPGDFFMVPPHAVHREGNPGADEQVLVVIRSGSGPTVVNVEGSAPA